MRKSLAVTVPSDTDVCPCVQFPAPRQLSNNEKKIPSSVASVLRCLCELCTPYFCLLLFIFYLTTFRQTDYSGQRYTVNNVNKSRCYFYTQQQLTEEARLQIRE